MCTKCSKEVAWVDLPYVRSKADGRKLSYCMQCRYKQVSSSYYETPEKFFAFREQSLARPSRKSARESRNHIECDIPKGYLLALWQVQQGLCFYTQQQMVIQQNVPIAQTISVDRVDESKGYIVGNIVLCLYRINSIKSDLSLEEMKSYLPVWFEKIKIELPSLDKAVDRILNA